MNTFSMTESVPQAPWTTEGAAKRDAVQSLFAEIAPKYDLLNGILSLRLHHRWRKYAVRMLNLRPGEFVVDVCCGTGDFMLPLRKAVGESGRVLGVDFCLPMLTETARKDLQQSVSLGDACRLPIRSASVDAVTVGWGIRNVPDIDQAHTEIVRVLKSGGRFVSLDMSRPKQPLIRSISTWLFKHVVPKLGAVFGYRRAYTYLPESSQRFWSREQLLDSMRKAGFDEVGTKDLFFGNVCMHWGIRK